MYLCSLQLISLVHANEMSVIGCRVWSAVATVPGEIWIGVITNILTDIYFRLVCLNSVERVRNWEGIRLSTQYANWPTRCAEDFHSDAVCGSKSFLIIFIVCQLVKELHAFHGSGRIFIYWYFLKSVSNCVCGASRSSGSKKKKNSNPLAFLEIKCALLCSWQSATCPISRATSIHFTTSHPIF
jgi:hypothetical protein